MGCIQVSGREGLDSHTWCVRNRNVKRSNPFHSGSDLLKLLQGAGVDTPLELLQLLVRPLHRVPALRLLVWATGG
jgi:hypothetical protein